MKQNVETQFLNVWFVYLSEKHEFGHITQVPAGLQKYGAGTPCQICQTGVKYCPLVVPFLCLSGLLFIYNNIQCHSIIRVQSHE